MKRAHSLLDYAKEVNGTKTVELEDLDIHLLDPHISLRKIDTNALYNILSLAYHFEDVKMEEKVVTTSSSTDKRQRYFCDTTKCFQCGEAGHEFRECTRALKRDVCDLCSREGHERTYCPYRHCPKCRRFGHSSKNCSFPEDLNGSKICKACPTGSHSIADCCRTWKRYRLNGNTSKYTIYKACPICLSKRHFIDDCFSVERSQSSIFSSSYAELAKFYNKQ
ncbi:arginine methyltransferase-interacting protein [Encephalitozoon intestinalis ATCC 50506]|uniref:Arginine methyltransferase-interacting protein n=1 Tax=Encephalitozoon intestinalis (strain ATCC 50506) TaxID=876142 RepID=E0SAC7_ENCIT|nr:arginine methyltransferase-interacting protein [Encephalitozoon intestinalis ATCC 50506]ADM12552.1 arginine methyltransferase-interacting protein [Encephalitozoon intestinalis ATCC 50506]UTX46408.1 hypothetical protein GPK93_11g20150 [Encephalitozoon intestinalis]